MESTQVPITHLAMAIDFQTFSNVAASEKVAEQRISTKCSLYNSFQVLSNDTDYGR